MPVSSVIVLVSHLVSGLYRNMSEFVRTCAIYLGIAVLVAVVMVAGMPGLRSQAFQMHGALLFALAPDSFGPPPSAIRAGPVAPLVSAISLDVIPGGVLPAPTQGKGLASSGANGLIANATSSSAPVVDASGVNASATNASGANGASVALAKVTEPGGALLSQTATQTLTKFGITLKQKEALIQYISRKYLIAVDAATMFVDTAYVIADEAGVDPLLLLSVVATESHFNPYAGGQSGGATGLMQIIFSLHREKFAKFGRAESMAFNPLANMRVGALILGDCVRRRGSIAQGLLCYCGASSPASDRGYTEKVLSERRRLALAGSIALKD
jgi:hypothetical protein